MELLWNELNLNRPPTSSWTADSGTFDVTNFTQCINRIYDELQSQEEFNVEATILSRLIYRMKTKFRHDKGMKNMEKVNRALQNYFYLSLDKEYNNLRQSIVISESNTVTLPTRQMLQYVLVRTQGFAKLMCRVQEVAFNAGEFLRARVVMGHAWTFSMIAWSTIARIWLLSRHLAKKCCTWYNSMYVFMNKLESIGVDWVPSNYCFPKNLKEWLSLPWINEKTKCILAVEQSPTNSMFSLIKTQDESPEMEEDPIRDTENELNKRKSLSNDEQKVVPVIHDIGVRISRESFDANLETRKKKSKKNKKIDIKNITTAEDLNLLLSYDSYPGLDKLQWKMIRKTINNKLLKLSQCENMKKRKIRLDKIIQSIQACIN